MMIESIHDQKVRALTNSFGKKRTLCRGDGGACKAKPDDENGAAMRVPEMPKQHR